MVKRAYVYCKASNSSCDEAVSFLEENGVVVICRDIKKNPFTKRELEKVIGFHNPKHYLDVTSTVYSKKKLDSTLPPRNELFKLIIENPDLLRQPIIVCGRLMTIGTGKKLLKDMFQIRNSDNGSGAINKRPRSGRR